MKSASSDRRPEEEDVSSTAYGPADVRDTPHVKPKLPTEDAPDQDADPWIGRVLSNVYEIEAKIGEGGMGAVYLARHIHLQKPFAIKVLSSTIDGKGNAVERLRQEARAASQIEHENIVDVMNFDRTDDGAVFIVMEMLKGESLSDCVGRGPIEIHRALPITFQICRALHAAHEHGIVHRDLKPENVFLTEKGQRTLVKVLDFGISKVKSADAEQVKMTRTGQLVGTPLYMSPEQARGESEIDRRVDVYAMGVMLFEMLTGAPPFEGRNYFELLWKHGNEPAPSMKDVNPNVYIPDAVDDVVMRTLAKDRDERYQTMEALEQALMEAAPEVPSLPAMPSLPPPHRAAAPAVKERLGTAKTEMVASSSGHLTESASRVSSDELALPQQAPRGLMIGIGVAALVVLGVLGAVLMDDDEARVAPIPPPVAATDPAEAAEDEGEPAVEAAEPPPGVDPPPSLPSTVSVHLASTPDGAAVWLGDEQLGTTPFVASLDPSDEAIELRFTKDGYLAQTVSVAVVEGVEVPEVRLRRRRAAPTNETGGPLPFKTGL